MKNILIIVALIVGLLTVGYFVGRKDSPNKVMEVSGTSTDITNNPVSPSVDDINVLNLSGKGLTKTPEYVFEQMNLEELNLSNNMLDGALQSQIGNLKNLKILNLSNNNFTGVPAEVGQLKNLEILNLSNNSLTGLPNELGNLYKLKLLDLSGNNYSEKDLQKIRENLPDSAVIKTK